MAHFRLDSSGRPGWPLWTGLSILVAALLALFLVVGLSTVGSTGHGWVHSALTPGRWALAPAEESGAAAGQQALASCAPLVPSNSTPAWNSSLPPHELDKGIFSTGTTARTRRFLHKLLTGQPTTMVVLGGSITERHSLAPEDPGYPEVIEEWIRSSFPSANFTKITNALGGTPSHYFARCVRQHAPETADLVLLEFNINNGGGMDSPNRRGHERLIRKLLMYPNRPAIMDIVVRRWALLEEKGNPVRFRFGADDDAFALAQYYHLPILSTRGLMFDRVAMMELDEGLDTPYFMANIDHPNAIGHRYMGEMVIQLLRRTLDDLALHPLSEIDNEQAFAPLPPPCIQGNWPALNNNCPFRDEFKAMMVKSDGFEWVNEGTEERPKWGWVGTEVGATISFRVNTSMDFSEADDNMRSVAVVHLNSYEHMGKAEMTCLSGCTCEPSVFSGHWDIHISQAFFEFFSVTQAEECVVQARIINETESGEHKVKLLGVIISDVSDGGGDSLRVDLGALH